MCSDINVKLKEQLKPKRYVIAVKSLQRETKRHNKRHIEREADKYEDKNVGLIVGLSD